MLTHPYEKGIIILTLKMRFCGTEMLNDLFKVTQLIKSGMWILQFCLGPEPNGLSMLDAMI